MTRTFQALALLGEAGADGCPSLLACTSSRRLKVVIMLLSFSPMPEDALFASVPQE